MPQALDSSAPAGEGGRVPFGGVVSANRLSVVVSCSQAREAAGLRLLVATHSDTDEDPEKTAEMVDKSLDIRQRTHSLTHSH